MKKTYIKPKMQVHQILHRGILLTSGSKKIYGKIGDDEIDALRYKGYVTDENEEDIDPD